jgi:hypothetical protein
MSSFIAVDSNNQPIETYIAAGSSVDVAVWGPPVTLAESQPVGGMQFPNISNGNPLLVSWTPFPDVAWLTGQNPNINAVLNSTASWVDYNTGTSIFSYWQTIQNPSVDIVGFFYVVAFQ